MKLFNSIMSLRPRLLIAVLIFSMTMMRNNVVANDEYKKIILDLPAESDFDHYLSALEKVVDFCVRHKHYVDLDLQFGLFLMDVNLKQVMQQKRIRIPLETRSRLEKIFLKNNALTDYFHHMVQTHQNVPKIGQNIKLHPIVATNSRPRPSRPTGHLYTVSPWIVSTAEFYKQKRVLTRRPYSLENPFWNNFRVSRLFYNATTWPKPLDTFNVNLLNETNIYSPEQLEEIYGRWEEYYINVNNCKGYSPAESDACIAFLGRSPPVRFNRRFQPNCLTPLRCKMLVQEGNEIGYGLTHRLLYLIIARFSRRCIVFSEREDKLRTNMYCKKGFNEAEYIASNNFLLPDLLYEQIAVCGLLGHAQFIRKSWFKALLQFQTSEGCFSEKIATGDFDENQMREDKYDEWKILRHLDIMNGQCNGHLTGVAAAALSNALRFILEDYY